MSRVFSVAVEGSSRIFRLPKRAIFDNEDSKATRFAEIDARAFLKAQHGNRTRRVSNRPQYSGKQWFWTQSNAKHSACGGPPTLFHTFGCWRPDLTGMFLVWGTNYTWLRSRPVHTPLYFFTFKILLIGTSKKALFCIFCELMWDTAAVCDHQRDMAIHFDLQVSARNELWFVVEICEANLQPLQNFVPQRKLLSKYSESWTAPPSHGARLLAPMLRTASSGVLCKEPTMLSDLDQWRQWQSSC